jgi:hypothetical protein
MWLYTNLACYHELPCGKLLQSLQSCNRFNTLFYTVITVVPGYFFKKALHFAPGMKLTQGI